VFFTFTKTGSYKKQLLHSSGAHSVEKDLRVAASRTTLAYEQLLYHLEYREAADNVTTTTVMTTTTEQQPISMFLRYN